MRVSLILAQGELTQIEFGTESDFRAAWETLDRYADKRWSFTGCASPVIMERLGIQRAFAFDQRFQQFGTVAVVPWLRTGPVPLAYRAVATARTSRSTVTLISPGYVICSSTCLAMSRAISAA